MKQKQLDEMTERLGKALRVARHACHLASDDAAVLLRIPPSELFEYERGLTRMPREVLEQICIMGYKMMHLRIMENKYRRQRSFMRKLKQTVAALP